jgi:hypothetical protein
VTAENRKTRFKPERRHTGYTAIPGSFSVVLQGVRDALPEDIFITGEGDFFEKTDVKVPEGMTLDQACFQYFLQGSGHLTLATNIIESFEPMRSGAVSDQRKREIVSNLAGFLYDHYPEAYKAQVKK